MFSESVELYDLVYGAFKDYEAEAVRIAEVIRERHPSASTVLDVGCGTGKHAEHLTRDHGFSVSGIDLEAGFVEVAQARCPGGDFIAADMADFDMSGRTFDVVTSLFSSIGYVRTLDRVESTARCIARHLKPGGVALVEPWFEPEDMTSGRCYLVPVDTPAIKVARASHTYIDGRISRLTFHYLVAREQGIEHFEEVHELGLFTRDEMQSAFESGGLTVVDYDAEGLTGRGLWVLTAPEPTPATT